MEIEIKTEDRFTIVILKGEVDLQYSPTARKEILKFLGKNKNVLVDLSQVQYIDSSGVAILVEGYQMAKKNKLEFILVGPSDAAKQVLQLARLDKIFPISATVADAVNKKK